MTKPAAPIKGRYLLHFSYKGAAAGLQVGASLLLVAGGLMLTRVLRGMSQLQDCALSGRSNCR